MRPGPKSLFPQSTVILKGLAYITQYSAKEIYIYYEASAKKMEKRNLSYVNGDHAPPLLILPIVLDEILMWEISVNSGGHAFRGVLYSNQVFY